MEMTDLVVDDIGDSMDNLNIDELMEVETNGSIEQPNKKHKKHSPIPTGVHKKKDRLALS